jgi:hypothetical protein
LASVLQQSRAEHVVIRGNLGQLTMLTPIASGITATVTLSYNLNTGAPTRWQASWSGGKVVENVRSIRINPSAANNAVSFSPPAGVRAAVQVPGVSSPVPAILPPVSSDLKLVGAQWSSASPATLLLTYQTSQGTPVLITESRDHRIVAPPGVSVNTQTDGLLTIRSGAMPSGGRWAAAVIDHTTVSVQGPSQVVRSLFAGWANLSNASSTGSTAPSSTAG